MKMYLTLAIFCVLLATACSMPSKKGPNDKDRPNKECRDKRPTCKGVAYLCEDYERYMSKFCPQTCGMCSKNSEKKIKDLKKILNAIWKTPKHFERSRNFPNEKSTS
ncbi:uncharacterized protein [Clytia hemisphaerica]|uniref:ShKT domain-containing protein n=1 Tax=Clytia hemisphaerica TaxID=252671 RepID=A0A7M5VH84_9CNID